MKHRKHRNLSSKSSAASFKKIKLFCKYTARNNKLGKRFSRECVFRTKQGVGVTAGVEYLGMWNHRSACVFMAVRFQHRKAGCRFAHEVFPKQGGGALEIVGMGWGG